MGDTAGWSCGREAAGAVGSGEQSPLAVRVVATLAGMLVALLSPELVQANVPALGTLLQAEPLRTTGPETRAPAGHVAFCEVAPADCQVVLTPDVALTDGRIPFSDGIYVEMDEINRAVNAAIRPISEDPAGPDLWQADVSAGDCEDFALTKRRHLLALGWPSSALVMATAYIPRGDYHAVLLARTDQGDFVLDNLVERILPWTRTGYRFVKVESSVDPRAWYRVAAR